MTREEALDTIIRWKDNAIIFCGDTEVIESYAAEEIVKSIYDDIESRVCENCKYYDYLSRENGKTSRAMPYYVCRSDYLEADGGWFQPYDEHFGCNRFERKLESK